MKRIELLKNSDQIKESQLESKVAQEKAELEMQIILQQAKVKQAEADVAGAELDVKKAQEALEAAWSKEKFDLKKIITIQGLIENETARVEDAKGVKAHEEKWLETLNTWLTERF